MSLLFLILEDTNRCSLATAELYLTIAYIFRRFELQLHDTRYKDIEVVWDNFGGERCEEARGVRVKVTKERN